MQEVVVAGWNYDASVAKVKPLVGKWNEITAEMLEELRRAKIALGEHGGDRRSESFKSTSVHLKTWDSYCEDIGLVTRTADRWISKYFPAPPKRQAQLQSMDLPSLESPRHVSISETNRIYPIDCLEGMGSLKDVVADCCVTSPPYYGQRDYGIDGQMGEEPTPEAYVMWLVRVFQEVRRILSRDGTLWLNLGDANKNKQLLGIPWKVAFALQADGWLLRSEIIWHKPAPMPDGAKDRPTRAHEQIFLFSQQPEYRYNQEAVATPTKNGDGAPRKFREKDAKHTKRGDTGRAYEPRETANLRDVWTVGHQPSREEHAANFPEKLVVPCVLAGSRPGAVVLDPFMGTGTTAVVAKANGRRWVGFEINPKYIEIAERRLSVTTEGLGV